MTPEQLTGRFRKGLLIFDGAMGTELYRRNFFVNASYENLCLAAPHVVGAVHQAYREAGAQVMTANSYGANFNKLNKFGLGDKVAAINAAAVRLARAATVDAADMLVAGSVGPLGDEPAGSGYTPERRVEMLAEHFGALAAAGADFLIFESLESLAELDLVLSALQAHPVAIPCVFSFRVDENACLTDGAPVVGAFARAEAADAAARPTAFGLNCGLGPEPMLRALELARAGTALPLVVQPNAGMPKRVDERTIYMCSPEYFTTYAMRYAALGVAGIGGCCGTTPDDIRDMVRSVNPLARAQSHASIFTAPAAEPQPETPFAERSGMAAKLARREWLCNVEIVPPQGFDLSSTVEKARQCREAGFTAVNIPDGPRASSRVSSLVTAFTIQRDAGIEAVLHQCCRDRNLIAMQAELLGCAALGVRNLLFITGDPPKLGDYPFASGVFDVDSVGLIKLQSRLNHGLDLGGKSLGMTTSAAIGAGADPNALDFAREVRRTREKIAAGANYIVTQPVFDAAALLRFMDAVPELAETPLIAGIWPLASFRNAEFMRTEVPGVTVPDAVMARMGAAESREEQREAGISIAREAIAAIRGRVAGVQVSAPFGNVQTAIAVVR